MATEAQIIANRRHLTNNRLTSYELFMQNKPNLMNTKTNLTSALTKDYENKPPLGTLRKQTQSNPISKPFFALLASPIGLFQQPFADADRIRANLNKCAKNPKKSQKITRFQPVFYKNYLW